MKLKTRVVSLVEQAQEHSRNMGAKMKLGLMTVSTTAMLAVPTLSAYAAEEVSGGQNLLDGEVMAAITNGFSSLVITATAVVAIAATTGVSIIGLSAAVKYSMKKIRGVLSSAA